MKKLLSILGLSAAATFVFGGAAQASYPPDSVGTITFGDPVCNYSDDDPPQLLSWSIDVYYETYTYDARLAVIDPSGHNVAIDGDVVMGHGAVTVDSTTDGLGGVSGSNFIVELSNGVDVVTARAPGCTQIDPPQPARLEVQQSDCRLTNPNDPSSPLDNWHFLVFTDSPGEPNQITITAEDGSMSYSVAVPQGENSVVINASIPEFASALAPYRDYNVTWNGAGSEPLYGSVNGCPDPTNLREPYLRTSDIVCENAADPMAPWRAMVDLYSPTEKARFEIYNSVGELVYGSDQVGRLPEQYFIRQDWQGFENQHSEYRDYTARLVIEGREPLVAAIHGCKKVDGPTSVASTPRDELPKTGLDSTALGMIAFTMSVGGGGLVWAARRREAVSS